MVVSIFGLCLYCPMSLGIASQPTILFLAACGNILIFKSTSHKFETIVGRHRASWKHVMAGGCLHAARAECVICNYHLHEQEERRRRRNILIQEYLNVANSLVFILCNLQFPFA